MSGYYLSTGSVTFSRLTPQLYVLDAFPACTNPATLGPRAYDPKGPGATGEGWVVPVTDRTGDGRPTGHIPRSSRSTPPRTRDLRQAGSQNHCEAKLALWLHTQVSQVSWACGQGYGGSKVFKKSHVCSHFMVGQHSHFSCPPNILQILWSVHPIPHPIQDNITKSPRT